METKGFNPEIEHEPVDLSLQELVIAEGMLNNNPANTTEYKVDTDGSKLVQAMDEARFGELASKFRDNPKDNLGYGRANLMAIQKDKNLPKGEIEQRVQRYLDAFLDLQIKLDRVAYPPDDMLRNFIPSYVPDNLTDLGGDPQIDPAWRSREKIRVNKTEIFKLARPLFDKVFSSNIEGMELSEWKRRVIKETNDFVYTNMPYNRTKPIRSSALGRSIRMDEVFDQRLAVCRHHALMAQVLLQSFGLTSRLLKCNADFGSGHSGRHAANLVRVDYRWYVLDVTNPDIVDGRGGIYIRQIPEKEIDLNTKNYIWHFPRSGGAKGRTYESHHDMYFKISKD